MSRQGLSCSGIIDDYNFIVEQTYFFYEQVYQHFRFLLQREFVKIRNFLSVELKRDCSMRICFSSSAFFPLSSRKRFIAVLLMPPFSIAVIILFMEFSVSFSKIRLNKAVSHTSVIISRFELISRAEKTYFFHI